jgi:predicted nucleic acid-binding protein
MRKVVSNTTPIINLLKIGKLDILRELYGKVKVPQAVYHEKAKERGLINAVAPFLQELRNKSSWIDDNLFEKALRIADEY